MSEDNKKDDNPALQMLYEINSADWAEDTPTDVAVNHDRYLAEAYADPNTMIAEA